MNDSNAWADAVETVGILGGGTIGASWAALFLAAGCKVQVFDPSPDVEDYVRDYVKHAWPSLEALGMTGTGDPDRVSFLTGPGDAVTGAQFVQESVPERIEPKLALYREIEPALAPDALLATSSSGLLLGDLQRGWNDPARFILGHPFNPPHLIPLVELLANERTAAGTLEDAEAFYARCGKVTIRVKKEVPAHVANRLQAALWREAIHLVIDGVASVEDVDKAIHAGPGLRWSVMGPHMLFNLGSGGHGLEVFCERFGESFHHWWDDLGAPRLTPEVAAAIAGGVRDEEAGRSFGALAHERDQKIVAALRALKQVDEQLQNAGVQPDRATTAR